MNRTFGPHHLIGAFCLTLLATIALFWFAFLPQRVTAHLSTFAEEGAALGFAYAGRATLSFNDGLEAHVSKARFANAAVPSTFTIEAETLRIPVDLAGLLRGPGDLASLRFDGALISVDIGSPQADAGSAASKVSLDTIKAPQRGIEASFSNSQILFQDHATGFKVTLEDINGRVSVDQEQRLLVHVTGLLNGVFTTLRIEADEANRMAGDGAPTDVLLSSDMGEVRFSGRAGLGKGLALDGRTAVASRRTGELLSWLGLPASLAPACALELEGAFSLRKTQIEFPELSIRLHPAFAKGRLMLKKDKDRFIVDGVLNSDDVSLSALWPNLGKNDEWQDKSFPWLPWPKIDGKLQLNSQRLSIGPLQLEQAQIAARVNDSSADVSLSTAAGHVTGSTSLQNSNPPTVQLKAEIKDVPGAQISGGLFGEQWLGGRVAGKLDAAATGGSWAALVSTLSGQTELKVDGGAIKGYALKDLLNSPGKGWRTVPGDYSPNLSARLSGTITEGIIVLSSSGITADEVALPVKGEIDLLRQDLALEINPKDAKAWPDSISVRGRWSEPDFGIETTKSSKAPLSPESTPN